MSITIPSKYEKVVQEKVKTGRYASATEVVVEALELLERQDKARAQQRSELEAKLLEGAAQLERGDTISDDEAYSQLKERLAESR